MHLSAAARLAPEVTDGKGGGETQVLHCCSLFVGFEREEIYAHVSLDISQ